MLIGGEGTRADNVLKEGMKCTLLSVVGSVHEIFVIPKSVETRSILMIVVPLPRPA